MKIFKYMLMVLVLIFTIQAMAKDLTGHSIYQIGSKWITQDGKEVELKDFQGKPTILSMVYLTCKYICPTVISEVQSIEEKLGKNKNDVQIVLVSFDPERDKPATMKEYASHRKLDLQRWTLMTNQNESKIRELAVATGFKYQKDEKGEFTHSYMILALDRDGVVIERLDGANLDHQPMINALNTMVKEK